MGFGLIGVVALFLLILLPNAIKIMREYERGVTYTLGRFSGLKGPGIIFLFPVLQQMVRVDLRVRTLEVPSQDIISKDNISVKVGAVIYFRVVTPESAVNNVADFMRATYELAQTTLREVLGKHDLDEMLSERDKIAAAVREAIDVQTEPWGVKVSNVALKNIDIAESMIRAIGRQAEAERERRAKIISAEGESQAAAKLVEAATQLLAQPGGMELRYLSALQDMADDKSKVILLPLPLDLLKRLT
jgi:regulator of protease activity HflC (stomatin/prohibitin superfamily)